MSISLVKGQRIDLTKNNAGLKNLLVGLGWDPVEVKRGLFGIKKSADIDLDSSVLMLRNDKLESKDDLIYFANLKSKCGGVIHTGDNLTGDGDGDDEQILIDLSKINPDVNRIIFVINIYACEARKQDFGMIKNAYIRIADNSSKKELIKYSLTDDYSGKTALIVGEVYKHNGEWKFAALGEGTNHTRLSDIAADYR